jgi:hypothetical protein
LTPLVEYQYTEQRYENFKDPLREFSQNGGTSNNCRISETSLLAIAQITRLEVVRCIVPHQSLPCKSTEGYFERDYFSKKCFWLLKNSKYYCKNLKV